MRIEIDKNSGFCFGVTTAIRKAEEVLANGAALRCLGDIVHNNGECERLHALGLQTITHADFATLPAGTKVLLRAHGEPPATYAAARERGIEIIDATCPVVLGLQRRIRREHETSPTTQIVIYGKRGHAEVLGLVGQTEGEAIVIETLEEARALDLSRPIALFSQTTMPLEGFQQIVEYLTSRTEPSLTASASTEPSATAFRSFDTICRSVANRLSGVREFAACHDVVVFVCGLKSSNGHVLYEACRAVNPRTHLVDSPTSIQPEWFADAESVGVCGATSTPGWLMEACRDSIREALVQEP